MTDIDWIDFTAGTVGNKIDGVVHSKEMDDVILMQYTGLKDKNGKEIWEGDVVKFGKKPENLTQIGPINWNQKAWAFNPFTKPKYGKKRIFEVVGNIYENPELIKSASHNETESE